MISKFCAKNNLSKIFVYMPKYRFKKETKIILLIYGNLLLVMIIIKFQDPINVES
jgi:hypothetical protein